MKRMKKSEQSTIRLLHTPLWKRASLVLLTSAMLLGAYGVQMMSATAEPVLISKRQQGWNCDLKVARLMKDNKLVLQLDVLEKPETTYANVVYQVFLRQGERWVEVHTSKGARLIEKSLGRKVLAPEVISLKDLEDRFGKQIDWSRAELRTVALVRYDARGERRDQRVVFEQTQSYSNIAQTETTQIVGLREQREVSYERDRQEGIREGDRRDQEGYFSLAVLQKRTTLSNVIARISVQNRVSNGFAGERFIGDYRYQINRRAKFIKGLKQGDRVIVRLFTPENRLIGYSTFELLNRNAAVNLILSDRVETGIVRTVYGLDANQDNQIDQRTTVYDYFSQVTQVARWSDARVNFFKSVSNLNLSTFEYAGLPAPRSNCVYPESLRTGSFSLVSRVVRVFYSGLASALTTTPGRLVQIVNVSSTSVSIYEVTQLFATYRSVGISQGVITSTCDLGCIGGGNDRDDDDDDDDNDDREREGDDDDDDDGGDDDDDDNGGDDDDDDDGRDKPRRRNCNQGIGNGAEGCDPGNSSPRGGSNDEGGRRPGKKR
jgi:hypothetical protein